MGLWMPIAQTSGHLHLSSFRAPVPITHKAQTLTRRRNLSDHFCPAMHLPLQAVRPPSTRDPPAVMRSKPTSY